MVTIDLGIKVPRASIVQQLKHRDGNHCAHPECGKEFSDSNPATIDHFWLPLSKGGTWDLDNLKLMCRSCNSKKSDIIPNPDGTLPKVGKSISPSRRRRIRLAERPAVCGNCQSGRDLGPDESCSVCGSNPMPRVYPRWAKVSPKDCDHDVFWCWLEAIEPGLRKAAIHDVVNSGELD